MTQHLRYANVSTGGVFVCSMHCPACTLNYGLLSLATLAANLAVGGALCEAYGLGVVHGFEVTSDPYQIETWRSWRPNIDGSEAPGHNLARAED